MTSESGFDPDLLKRFPIPEPRPEAEEKELKRVWAPPTGWKLITAVNNNYIGLFYVGAAFLFFLLAGVLALLMRTQLALPLNGVLGQETYNQVFTMHGTTMMFLFAVPAVEAMGVLLLPQMLAARDLPFPRLSAYAFWAYLVGGLCFFASIFFGLAPSGGWFMYPPLTSYEHSPGINADFWLLGIGFIEISAIAGAIEIVVGILKTRAPGMTLDKLPVFAWAMLVFAGMVMIGFPSIIVATALLELERALHWPFFIAAKGGDPLLWQHLFWFFGHPEVYIIFLPAAGMLSMIVPTAARTPLVAYRLVVLAQIATGFLAFGVWVHHMFATGLPPISVSVFSAAGSAVSIPAGLQVFAWIATLAAGRFRPDPPGLFAVGGIVTFVIGGLTGVMVALVPFDWQVHDTHFVVAHLHYVLIGGMVFPLFAGFYYWAPMISRKPLSKRLGRIAFWLMFTGMQVTFLPMHLTGLMGMPRRVWTYQPGHGWETVNLISTIGAFTIAAGVAVFILDLIRNFRFSVGDTAGNVYEGGTLEWLPGDVYSTRSIPVVDSRYPLWDRPQISKEVEEGRHLLPYAATGFRETIITSPIKAEPQYLMRMPGPSFWHVGAAVATAVFFLLLTVQLYWIGVAFGVVAIACIFRWVWEIDRPLPVDEVDIGGGIRLPTYVTGPGSHGWWAMIVLLVVLAMIFAMTVFTYVFLWSRDPVGWPPSDAGLPGAGSGWGALALYVLAGLALWLSAWWIRTRPRQLAWLLPLGALLTAGAGLVDFRGHWETGLRGYQSAYGASVYAIAGLQAVLAACVILFAAGMAVRAARGMADGRIRAGYEALALLWGYTVAQGAVGLALTRLFPVLAP
ncbi:cbb3-type cytochrome c oxidase subunit I [Phenylobacterium sp.]|uniref:cbb3-type cytochrome c oxidase subunit I n=1 Tax=Phenylobacterium sp. TaxID=1871053 RepID=UPI002B7B73A6|nr:cbb3-type cytochrome c oxidase subunit I [Phenylobacterium sp.]HVI33096.1 cbb3-type cytochrome c oxidase subunit I [Phenylobacterium sp.]